MAITRMHTTERASKIVTHNGVVYFAGQVAEDAEADNEGTAVSQVRRFSGRVAG